MMSDMNVFTCGNYKELVDEIMGALEHIKHCSSESGDIAIVAKYDEASKILAELCARGFVPYSVEITNPEWFDYNCEYIISLIDNELWCQPMKFSDGRYVDDESTLTYVSGNANSACLAHLPKVGIIEFDIIDTSDDMPFDNTAESDYEDEYENDYSFVAPDWLEEFKDEPVTSCKGGCTCGKTNDPYFSYSVTRSANDGYINWYVSSDNPLPDSTIDDLIGITLRPF